MEGRRKVGRGNDKTEKAPIPKQYHRELEFQAAWSSMRFDRKGLATTACEPVRIYHPGTHNFDQGPDFLHADLQIGKQRLHGHVELHLNADDWQRHGHHLDPQYNAVVLHVYLDEGKRSARRSDGTEVPGLRLGERIGDARLFSGKLPLPCSGLGNLFLPPDASGWLEQMGAARLDKRMQQMGDALQANGLDWGQLLWQWLAIALGGPVNGAAFEELARQVPWEMVRKYHFSETTMEALLFGSVGALSGRPLDAYHEHLQAEWQFLQSKHGLQPRPIMFKFHRMHPAGFPTVRIAQLAALAHRFRPLHQLLELEQIVSFLEEDFEGISDYWAVRYEFGNTLNSRRNELGKDTKIRLATNVLLPMACLYASSHQVQVDKDQYLDVLRGMPPETNKLTRKFAPIGLQAVNGLQSQGLIGLHKELCSGSRCMECPIGAAALRRCAN